MDGIRAKRIRERESVSPEVKIGRREGLFPWPLFLAP